MLSLASAASFSDGVVTLVCTLDSGSQVTFTVMEGESV